MQKRRTAGAGFPPPAGAAGNAMQPQGFDAAVMQKVGAHASIFRAVIVIPEIMSAHRIPLTWGKKKNCGKKRVVEFL